MKKIRVGIIGCGVIAPLHAKCFRQHQDVEILWACDLDTDKAAALAEKYDIPNTTADYRQVLASGAVDLISICTDHASHSEIAIAALEAGCHVICEKALAHNSTALDAMLAAGDAHPELVFAGIFQHRHEPAKMYIHELVRSGALGTLLTAGTRINCWRGPEYYTGDDWRGTWDKEGGAVLINQAIHFIDVLQWIAGPATAVSGFYNNLLHRDCIETEDVATASLAFANGSVGIIEATSASHMRWDPVIFFNGSEGTIEMRNDKPEKIVFRDESLAEKVANKLHAAIEQRTILAKDYYGSGHSAQIADILEAVRKGTQPKVTAKSAAQTVDIVLAVYESCRSGKRVDLAPRVE